MTLLADISDGCASSAFDRWNCLNESHLYSSLDLDESSLQHGLPQLESLSSEGTPPWFYGAHAHIENSHQKIATASSGLGPFYPPVSTPSVSSGSLTVYCYYFSAPSKSLSPNGSPGLEDCLDQCILPYTPAQFQQQSVSESFKGALLSPFLFECPIRRTSRIPSSPLLSGVDSDSEEGGSPCCNPSALCSVSPFLGSTPDCLPPCPSSEDSIPRRSERKRGSRFSPIPQGEEERRTARTAQRTLRVHSSHGGYDSIDGVNEDDEDDSDYDGAEHSSRKTHSCNRSSKPVLSRSGKGLTRKKRTYTYESISEARRRIQAKALQGSPYRDVATDNVKTANRRNSDSPKFFCSLCLKDGKPEGFTHVFRCWSHLFSHFDIRPYQCACSWVGCTIDAVGRHVDSENKKAEGKSGCKILDLKEPIDAWLGLTAEFGGYAVPAVTATTKARRKRDRLQDP